MEWYEIAEQSFNTSHVVVYPTHWLKDFLDNPFQYISCCCLSERGHYIHRDCPVSIHLMLLFIGGRTMLTNTDISFNTSHVVVYLYSWNIRTKLDRVSIHLMLLFIENSDMYRTIKKQFQYISCCCLSRSNAHIIHNAGVSIHLMLLFI